MAQSLREGNVTNSCLLPLLFITTKFSCLDAYAFLELLMRGYLKIMSSTSLQVSQISLFYTF